MLLGAQCHGYHPHILPHSLYQGAGVDPRKAEDGGPVVPHLALPRCQGHPAEEEGERGEDRDGDHIL